MNLPELLYNWQLIVFVSFCTIAAIQVFYYLFFFSRIAFHRTRTRAVTQTHPVSVIVCARDEAANLAKNLPGILVQKYPTTHEVIVVNDNSYDESKYVLEELQRQFRQLHIVELTQEAKMIPGKKFPLSVGIKTAKHEIMLMTDADCVPASENWIYSMQNAYDEQTEIVIGYGAYHKKKGLLNKLVRWETFHSAVQYLGYAAAKMPYMGVGRNLSYKKAVFLRQKGFSAHNHIPGGDDDLFINKAANKKNTKINLDPDSFTLSEPVGTFKKWKAQKQRHYTTSKHYRKIHQFLLALYAFSHFAFYPLLILAIIFYSWKPALAIFGGRLIIQGIIFGRSLKKLGEKDLIPLILFMDIWMFFYYLIFAPGLFKKPARNWK